MQPHQLLKTSKQQYELSVIEVFTEWASLYAKDDKRIMQKILTSQPIFNWFQLEFNKCLNEFKTQVKPYYHTMETIDLQRHFVLVVERIFTVYPITLLKEAYKTEILTKTK